MSVGDRSRRQHKDKNYFAKKTLFGVLLSKIRGIAAPSVRFRAAERRHRAGVVAAQEVPRPWRAGLAR